MPETVVERLRRAGIEAPEREARFLAAVADPGALVRRLAREPLSRIRGCREFWSLEFQITPDTLDPRPDSETLITASLAMFPDTKAALRIADLGTGSGCLLLAALHEFPAAHGIGIDISERALTVARRNALALGLEQRSDFLAADWARGVDAVFDLVLCNPPYIPSADIDTLQPEVRLYDPRSALDGGADGIAAYRALARIIPLILKENGCAVLELGFDQQAPVRALFAAAGMPCVRLYPDLNGIPRAAVLKKTLACAADWSIVPAER